MLLPGLASINTSLYSMLKSVCVAPQPWFKILYHLCKCVPHGYLILAVLCLNSLCLNVLPRKIWLGKCRMEKDRQELYLRAQRIHFAHKDLEFNPAYPQVDRGPISIYHLGSGCSCVLTCREEPLRRMNLCVYMTNFSHHEKPSSCISEALLMCIRHDISKHINHFQSIL